MVLVGMQSVESLRFDIEHKECWVHEVPLDGELVHVSFTVFKINQWAYRHTGADLVVSGLNYINLYNPPFSLSLLRCPPMIMSFIALLSCIFSFQTCDPTMSTHIQCRRISRSSNYVVGSVCIESAITLWDPKYYMYPGDKMLCQCVFSCFFFCPCANISFNLVIFHIEIQYPNMWNQLLKFHTSTLQHVGVHGTKPNRAFANPTCSPFAILE